MSLEISEIGIRMVVGDPAAQPPAKPGDGDAPHGSGAPLSPPQMDALVQACVHQVLSTLRLQGDR